jgi:hypothetical protein
MAANATKRFKSTFRNFSRRILMLFIMHDLDSGGPHLYLSKSSTREKENGCNDRMVWRTSEWW